MTCIYGIPVFTSKELDKFQYDVTSANTPQA